MTRSSTPLPVGETLFISADGCRSVSLQRARSIDDLHDRVTGADIALSAEAPLTLALDRRVDRPRVGRLSATPRSHASGELVPDDTRPLFLQLVTETNLPWKQAARALELCLDCWNRTGSLEQICDHPEFDTPAIRQTIDILQATPSSYAALATETLDPSEDIYVIDPEGLTPLDRNLLPGADSYETVSPFGAGEWSFPEFHLYPSATAIVDDLIAAIDADGAEQVGIVLDQSSIYSPLIEAALDAAEIPYQGGPSFIDGAAVRTFLRLLQACFSGGGITVSELRPLLAGAGIDVPRQHDNQRLEYVTADWAAQFRELRDRIRGGDFATALEAFAQYSSQETDLSTLEEELGALGLLTAEVTADRVDQVVYYLQSFEVPVDREREGVLLTDAASTAYVDRPVVFYLGLGDGWAQTPPDYPWVDAPAFIEQDMRRFELLVQNGQQQYFLVQESRSGEEISPCVYLQEFLEEEFDTFSDLPHVEHRSISSPPAEAPFDASEGLDSTPDPVTSMSQSTLARLVNCPREHYFHRLVDAPESLPMARGTVLHEAAEVYVNNPEFVDDHRERLLTAMCDQLQPYLSDTRRAVLRTQLDVGLAVLIEYLDQNPPQEAGFDTYGSPKQENALAEALDIRVDSPLCERWFETPEVGGHGYVDLLQNRTTLVDFKTGSKRPSNTVQKEASLDPIDDTPDFQVLLYLAHHRRECPDETLQFRFIYLLDAVDEVVKGDPIPLEDLVTTITYVPCSFSEFVARQAVFDQLTDYADGNPRCKVLHTLGYDRYREFFETHELPREGADPDARARIEAAFEELAVAEVGDYKYVNEGCAKIFSDLADVPTGYYLKGDLDAFEAFLAERLAELNEYRATRFPVSFDDADPNWDRVDHRDLILTDRSETAASQEESR